jgi:hypothetical protein
MGGKVAQVKGLEGFVGFNVAELGVEQELRVRNVFILVTKKHMLILFGLTKTTGAELSLKALVRSQCPQQVSCCWGEGRKILLLMHVKAKAYIVVCEGEAGVDDWRVTTL